MTRLFNRLRSDEALMLAYQRGNSAAFENLYLRHKDALFAFLYRSCQQPALVEELAQEAWMGVIRAAPNYEPRATFKTWLYQIAHNRLVDLWRRDREHLPLDKIPEPAADTTQGQREDRERELMAAIGQLAPDQRDTLLLQQQGFSQQEIAHITGTGEETVKSRLRYGRNHLRDIMGGAS